jgi:hypothetical protein
MMTTTPTPTNADELDLSNLGIFDMVDKLGMTLYDIFQKTDYTPEKAYPEVVSLILTLSLACQIANAYGNKFHVQAIKDKITEIYVEWIEVSGGKLPISDIEKHPADFKKAVEEMKRRVSKKRPE